MFGFLKSKPKPKTKVKDRSKQRLVSVNFREIPDVQRWGPNLKPNHGYTYKWNFKQEPVIGTWVIVQGMEGPATAIICKASTGVPKGFRMTDLKTVLKIMTDKEVQRALM